MQRQATAATFVVQVGSAIAGGRQQLGVSQEALARAVGVDGGLLCKIEAGRCLKMPLFTTYRIAQHLPQRSVDALCGLPPAVAPPRRGEALLATYRVHLLLQAYARLPEAVQMHLVSNAVELAQLEELGAWRSPQEGTA